MSRANLSVFEASSASKFTEFAANVNFLSLRNLASNELFFTVLFITFFGIFLVRIPITYVFLNIFNMGLAGAWIVMTIDLIFRSSLCFYVFKRGKWKYLKV